MAKPDERRSLKALGVLLKTVLKRKEDTEEKLVRLQAREASLLKEIASERQATQDDLDAANEALGNI